MPSENVERKLLQLSDFFQFLGGDKKVLRITPAIEDLFSESLYTFYINFVFNNLLCVDRIYLRFNSKCDLNLWFISNSRALEQKTGMLFVMRFLCEIA